MQPKRVSAPKAFTVVRLKKGLAIYKQGRSPYWYARAYVPFEGRYNQVISTKTESEREARKIAEDFFIECLIKKRAIGGDLPVGAKPPKDLRYAFASLADEFVASREKRAGKDPRAQRGATDTRDCERGQGIKPWREATYISPSRPSPASASARILQGPSKMHSCSAQLGLISPRKADSAAPFLPFVKTNFASKTDRNASVGYWPALR